MVARKKSVRSAASHTDARFCEWRQDVNDAKSWND